MTTCWETLCGSDCAYCPYKQARYRKGFGTLCYTWFHDQGIEKKCRECKFYAAQRELNPALPEDPAFHPPAKG